MMENCWLIAPLAVIGMTEWIIIGIVALLLFGSRLPDVARAVGRSVNQFKRGLSEVDDDVSKAGEAKPAPTPPTVKADEKKA
jgi:sec-independent protein translocase protein TatA